MRRVWRNLESGSFNSKIREKKDLWRKTENSLCLIFVLQVSNDHAVTKGKLRLQNAENVIEKFFCQRPSNTRCVKNSSQWKPSTMFDH